VTSGRVTFLFRVIFCFSSYFEVHAALRSLVVLGKKDHEESQIPDLFSPSNFCSHCVDQSHSTLSCEGKSDTSYCGFCGSPPMTLPPAPAKPLLARSLLHWLSDASLRPVTMR